VNLVNSFCVVSTLANVASYCACKPGYTGERCESPHTCTDNGCATNTKCDNEGICRCDPGRDGATCSNDNSDTECKKVTVITKEKWTADELPKRLAAYLNVDVVNFKVLEGPTARENGEGYRYVILVCRDENVDEKKTTDELVNKTANGGGEDAGFIDAQEGDVPDSSNMTSGASTCAAVATTVVAAAFACF